MFWRRRSQGIRAMKDPDLRAPGTDPIPGRRLVMDQQIRLESFNQTRDLRFLQSRMDRCAGELKRSALADREDVRIPAVCLMRTPQVEHALSAASGKVPRHEMNQSWTVCSVRHNLFVKLDNPVNQVRSDHEVYFPTSPLLAVPKNSHFQFLSHRTQPI